MSVEHDPISLAKDDVGPVEPEFAAVPTDLDLMDAEPVEVDFTHLARNPLDEFDLSPAHYVVAAVDLLPKDSESGAGLDVAQANPGPKHGAESDGAETVVKLAGADAPKAPAQTEEVPAAPVESQQPEEHPALETATATDTDLMRGAEYNTDLTRDPWAVTDPMPPRRPRNRQARKRLANASKPPQTADTASQSSDTEPSAPSTELASAPAPAAPPARALVEEVPSTPTRDVIEGHDVVRPGLFPPVNLLPDRTELAGPTDRVESANDPSAQVLIRNTSTVAEPAFAPLGGKEGDTGIIRLPQLAPSGSTEEILILTNAWGSLRRRLSPTDMMAFGVITLQAILALSILVPGSFLTTDLVNQAIRADGSLGANVLRWGQGDPAFLPRLINWLLASSPATALSHTPAVLITVLIKTILVTGTWFLIRRLVGSRGLSVTALALFCLTPALLPATAWFNHATGILLSTTALVFALLAHSSWHRHPTWSSVLGVATATAVAVSSHVQGLVVPFVLLALTLAVYTPGLRSGFGTRWWIVLWRSLLRGSTSILASVSTILLLWMTFGGVIGTQWAAPQWSSVGPLALKSTLTTVLPALMGGPGTWSYITDYYPLMVVSNTVTSLVGIAAVLWLAYAWRHSYRAVVRSATLWALWVLPLFVILSFVVRTPGTVNTIVLDLGQWPILTLATVLAGVLGALGWRDGALSSRAVFRQPRAAVPEHERAQGLPLLLGIIFLGVVFTASLLSTAHMARSWWANPTGDWLAALRSDVINSAVYARVVPTPLPLSVIPPQQQAALPHDGSLIRLWRDDLDLHNSDRSMRASGPTGALIEVRFEEVALAEQAECAALVESTARVTFTTPVDPILGGLLQVGTLSNAPEELQVSIETADGSVVPLQPETLTDIPAGAHRHHYTLPAGLSVAAAQITVQDAETCISPVRLVRPVS